MSAASGQSTEDLASSLLGAKGGSGLEASFAPQNVAVIGATEKAGQRRPDDPPEPGRQPVRRDRLSGQSEAARACWGSRPTRASPTVPDPVDLAVMVTPAPTVPDLMGECVEAGVRGAIIISAGFKEIGAEGVELERRVLEQARRGRMRVIGPNCLGVMNPIDRPERHLRRRHGQARQHRLPQPERRPLHRRPRLELHEPTSASAPSSRSARCSTSAGAT